MLQWGRNFIRKPEGGLHARAVQLASMGPQLYRFNGAATLSLRTLSLRKRRLYLRPKALLVRFNGAATLSLRKHLGDGQAPAGTASMGPRLYRCGNVEDGFSNVHRMRLLQWGRDFIVAETNGIGRLGIHPLSASMGPRLYRCGNEQIEEYTPPPNPGFNGAATLSLRKRHLGADNRFRL